MIIIPHARWNDQPTLKSILVFVHTATIQSLASVKNTPSTKPTRTKNKTAASPRESPTSYNPKQIHALPPNTNDSSEIFAVENKLCNFSCSSLYVHSPNAQYRVYLKFDLVIRCAITHLINKGCYTIISAATNFVRSTAWRSSTLTPQFSAIVDVRFEKKLAFRCAFNNCPKVY